MDGSMDWWFWIVSFFFHILGRVICTRWMVTTLYLFVLLCRPFSLQKSTRPCPTHKRLWQKRMREKEEKKKQQAENIKKKLKQKGEQSLYVHGARLECDRSKFPSLVSLPSITIQQSIFVCAAAPCHILIDNRKRRRQTNHIQHYIHTYTHSQPHERISNIITFISTLCMTFVSHTHH